MAAIVVTEATINEVTGNYPKPYPATPDVTLSPELQVLIAKGKLIGLMPITHELEATIRFYDGHYIYDINGKSEGHGFHVIRDWSIVTTDQAFHTLRAIVTGEYKKEKRLVAVEQVMYNNGITPGYIYGDEYVLWNEAFASPEGLSKFVSYCVDNEVINKGEAPYLSRK